MTANKKNPTPDDDGPASGFSANERRAVARVIEELQWALDTDEVGALEPREKLRALALVKTLRTPTKGDRLAHGSGIVERWRAPAYEAPDRRRSLLDAVTVAEKVDFAELPKSKLSEDVAFVVAYCLTLLGQEFHGSFRLLLEDETAFREAVECFRKSRPHGSDRKYPRGSPTSDGVFERLNNKARKLSKAAGRPGRAYARFTADEVQKARENAASKQP